MLSKHQFVDTNVADEAEATLGARVVEEAVEAFLEYMAKTPEERYQTAGEMETERGGTSGKASVSASEVKVPRGLK